LEDDGPWLAFAFVEGGEAAVEPGLPVVLAEVAPGPSVHTSGDARRAPWALEEGTDVGVAFSAEPVLRGPFGEQYALPGSALGDQSEFSLLRGSDGGTRLGNVERLHLICGFRVPRQGAAPKEELGGRAEASVVGPLEQASHHLSPLGIHRDRHPGDLRRGGRGDGFERVDPEDLRPHGIGERLGRGHADPKPGERAGALGHGDKLNVGRLPTHPAE
jgi:hypothetical protein